MATDASHGLGHEIGPKSQKATARRERLYKVIFYCLATVIAVVVCVYLLWSLRVWIRTESL